MSKIGRNDALKARSIAGEQLVMTSENERATQAQKTLDYFENTKGNLAVCIKNR